MSYNPRRTSGHSYSYASDDDHHLASPRPFFSRTRDDRDRGSWSADDPASDSDSPPTVARRARRRSSQPAHPAHAHTRTSSGNAYAAVDPDTPGIPNPFGSDADEHAPAHTGWNPASLYDDAAASVQPADPPRPRRDTGARAPPSAFAYPFQSYPGNPDPLPSRRSSVESIGAGARGGHAQAGSYASVPPSPSQPDLARPYAPFMADPSAHAPGSSGSIYGGSAAAGMQRGGSPGPGSESGHGHLPRNSSATFRAPFLSPASRPSSSLWSPPSYTYGAAPANTIYGPGPGSAGLLSPSASASALALPKPKAPLPSTRLAQKLEKDDKPWLGEKDARGRASWWLTFVLICAGVLGSAALCFFGYRGVNVLKGGLCLVMDDDFDSLDTSNNWSYDIELGGFGNGEFQATTDSTNNIYTSNSQLYLVPTLTSDIISGGASAIFDGGKLTLDNCSTSNKTACSASSSVKAGSVVNPVMSARINSKGKKSIQFGKVEVRAKLPAGDWLWPAVWMLPEDDAYGAWPLSGEIDIMEARGNGVAYAAQGNNFVRSSLNYGPLDSLTHTIFGWYSQKRTSFASAFHTYGMEWDEQFMRFYTDNRLNKMLELTTKSAKESFWHRGGFPQTAQNGSTQVVVQDIYAQGTNAAPFDKPFYMLIDLAAGGTSGWFPDGVGGKPWYDASGTAMKDFAYAQSTWHATWPESVDDRAFRIDYVKMWKQC